MRADMFGGAAARLAALVRALWGRAARDDSVSARIRRGQEIADRGGQIKGRSAQPLCGAVPVKDSKTYTVEYLSRGWSCGCPDHQNRKRNCKHIYAVIQRNTDAMCSKAGTDAPGGRVQEPPGEGDGASGSAAAAREEIIGRLAAHYPEQDIPGMLDMPFEDGVLAIKRMLDAWTRPMRAARMWPTSGGTRPRSWRCSWTRIRGRGAGASCWRRPARGHQVPRMRLPQARQVGRQESLEGPPAAVHV